MMGMNTADSVQVGQVTENENTYIFLPLSQRPPYLGDILVVGKQGCSVLPFRESEFFDESRFESLTS